MCIQKQLFVFRQCTVFLFLITTGNQILNCPTGFFVTFSYLFLLKYGSDPYMQMGNKIFYKTQKVLYKLLMPNV